MKNPGHSHAASLVQDRKVLALKQAAKWEELLKAANEEIDEVSKDIATLFPSEDLFHPVTVHLYQPVPIQAGDAVGHRLVDIGPKENRADAGLIAQVGGQTESFFQNREAYKRFVPTVLPITSDVVAEYRKLNPLERRAAQVAVERRRHPSVSGWPETDPAPPLDTYIHQVPLSPLPECFRLRTSHPVLGVVYTLSRHREAAAQKVDELSADEKRCVQAIHQLPVYAMRCGGAALRYRVEHVLCETRRALLEKNDLYLANWCVAIGSLLLAHHWFFRDPVARILIFKLLEKRELALDELKLLWTAPHIYGSSISKKEAQKDGRSTPELFEILCSDLEQLVSSINAGAKTTSDAKSHLRQAASAKMSSDAIYRLRQAAATMLMTMTGELYRWEPSGRDDLEKRARITFYGARNGNHKALTLVSKGPLVAAGQELCLCLPMVSEAEVRATRDVAGHLKIHVDALRPFVQVPTRTPKGSGKSAALRMVSKLGRVNAKTAEIEQCQWPEDGSQRWMRWLRELVYYRSAQEHRLVALLRGTSKQA